MESPVHNINIGKCPLRRIYLKSVPIYKCLKLCLTNWSRKEHQHFFFFFFCLISFLPFPLFPNFLFIRPFFSFSPSLTTCSSRRRKVSKPSEDKHLVLYSLAQVHNNRVHYIRSNSEITISSLALPPSCFSNIIFF